MNIRELTYSVKDRAYVAHGWHYFNLASPIGYKCIYARFPSDPGVLVEITGPGTQEGKTIIFLTGPDTDKHGMITNSNFAWLVSSKELEEYENIKNDKEPEQIIDPTVARNKRFQI